MKTETRVNEIKQEERQKVFWRLYGLPWILLVLVLFGFIAVNKNVDLKKLESYEEKGRLQGIEEIRKEAVEIGYAQWGVDPDTLEIVFMWYTKPEGPEELEKSNTTSQAKGFMDVGSKDGREYEFTQEDLKFAKSIGINLEEQIIGDVRVKVNQLFYIYKYQSKIKDMVEFEEVLKKDLEESIRSNFDGFETYKRVSN